MTCFTNGNVYQYKKDEGSLGLAIVFSVFADKDSILAVPVCDRPLPSSIPMLLDAGLVYISVCDVFRMRKDDVEAEVASVDTNSIETVVQHLCLAFKGYPKTISIPTAISLPNYSSDVNTIVNVKEEKAISSREKSNDRHKYTLDDYIFILKNFQNNTAEIMSRYGLKDRQAVYRVKNALSKRFGEASDTAPDPTTECEPTGEPRKCGKV